MQYFRSQIIPGDPDTMTYWFEHCGRCHDVLESDIPDGTVVHDITDIHNEETYVKGHDNG